MNAAPGPRLPSIRARLGTQLMLLALAGGVLMALAVWVAVRHEVDELRDETLQASAEVLGGLLATGDEAALQRAMSLDPSLARHEEHFAWQLLGPANRLLLRSARAPEQPFVPLRTPGFSDAARGWRVYGLPLAGGERMLLVAQTHEERREAGLELVLAAVWSALALGVVGAWWLRRRVRRELRPLAGLSAELAHYEPLQPQSALAAATRQELSVVRDAIEALGTRLARRVANERAFSAHAAHALRTPLAGIEAQLAVAQREAPPALQPRLARAREASARLTRVVAALLALFRSGSEPLRTAVDLEPLLRRLPHEALDLQLEAGAQVLADENLLGAALINLLDNAERHGARSVSISVGHHADAQHLRLHDDGQGAEAPRRAELSAALDAQDYEGHMGLGLMLADLVARAHGGVLLLPEVASGFAAELVLPTAPAPRAAGS